MLKIVSVDYLVMPDDCTSIHGCVPPREYYKDCSHAIFYGSVDIDAKKWLFEFNPRYGVNFKFKNGNFRVCPPEDHESWKQFDKWYDDKFGA